MTTVDMTTHVRNGVDTAKLFATIEAVKAQPEAAQFTFRVSNRWVSGTHNENHVNGFFGVGAEQDRGKEFVIEADHPEILVGGNHGPTGAELLLAALASCLTHGSGNIAAARKVALTSVESTVEGDVDLQGILGLSDEVRNGYRQIRVMFRVSGDAPAEKLQEIVRQSVARSAVYDVITQGTAVTIDVTTR
jgi:uncharacterized OsmC-like protein